MGCGASTVAPTADAGGGTSLTRQLTAAIDRTSKSTRVSTLQREAIEEADALLPEYMRLGVAVEWLREFVREHKIEKETTREVSLKMSAALAEGAELANIEAVQQQQPAMVSRATHFVSHAQNCSFRHLVDSLSIFEAQCESRNSDGGLAPMGRFYWLDIMSVRQKAVASGRPREHLAAHPAGSGREQAQRGDRQGDDGRAHRRRQTRIDGRRVVKAARRRLEIKNRI